jgi:hypothetical protein
MSSKTEICNFALSHIGVGKDISNIDTESSEEARTCRRFYDLARDATLRDFPWPFATKVVSLSLLETFTGSNNEEYTYSYRYPSDCLDVRKIKSTIRNDTRQSRVPLKILKDAAARIIYTDSEDAQLVYTERVKDPSFYPPDFQLALSFRLATYIAPRLAKGDPFKLKNDAMNMYDMEISRARAASANEEQRDELPYSEFERSRT